MNPLGIMLLKKKHNYLVASKRSNNSISDLILVTVGRLTTALLALIGIRASTSLLGPELYGELALLVAIQLFCGLFLINPVAQHINLHTHAWWDEGSLGTRMKSYGKYILAVSLLGGFIATLSGLEQPAIQQTCAAIAVISIVAAGTWNATSIPMLNMLGFRRESVILSIITAISCLVASITMTFLWRSATAWIAGQALGMLVGAIAARYVLHQQNQYMCLSMRLPLLSKHTLVTYCLPLCAATGLMWLQSSGYRFVINAYWGLASLGFMVVGLQIANQIFALVEAIFSQFLHPIFYRQISKQPDENIKSTTYSDMLNILAPLYFIIAGLIVMCAPYILQLLVSNEFQNASTFVILGVGIELCRVLGNLFGNASQITRKTSSLAVPYAAGAATSFALINLAGAQDMQIFVSGIALTLGAVAMLTVMGRSMTRQISFVPDKKQWLRGFMAMICLMSLTIWLPKETNIINAAVILVAATTGAGITGIFFLWKNPAVYRMLNINPKKEPQN